MELVQENTVRHFNRRDFVEQALVAASAALATGTVTTAVEPATSRKVGPNDKIRVAVIGVNGRVAATFPNG